jgi:CDP-diacylglycerol--glycerol-3-phosphate 3-phosphatidyltransferase
MAETQARTPPNTLRSLPNALTLARLVLVIPLFYFLTQLPETSKIALGIFLAAGLTDVLDGFVARRYSGQSVFGRLMDPATDKILVCGAFVFLVSKVPEVPAWVAVVILTRELGVTALRAVAEAQGHPYPGTISGKVKMLIESATICYVLIYVGYLKHPGGVWPKVVLWGMLILTLLGVLLSGLQHVVRSLRLIFSPPAGGAARPEGAGAAERQRAGT